MTVTNGLFVDATPTDPNNVWTREDTFFNNLIKDDSANGFTFDNGSTSINYTHGKTTNISEVSGETITQVRIRFRDSSNNATSNGSVYTSGLGELIGTLSHVGTSSGQDWKFSSWETLSSPSGGWTWNDIANLEMKVYATDIGSYVWLSYIEIEVTSEISITPNETNINIVLKTSTNKDIILKSTTNKDFVLK